MTIVKASEADAFVSRPDPARPVVLLYGPDAGLVHERAEALVRASVDSMSDPFSMIRIDGDDLSGNPHRLVEEANTIPMFGGRRAIWVRAGSRNIAPAVEALVTAPSPDCRVVIEAGDLKKTSPLRTICEKSRHAAAIGCYADSERDIGRVIDDAARRAGMSVAPEARAALIPLLGGDRQATRGEVDKLILYAHGRERIELDDVLAVVADASAVALDSVIDAAFSGRPAEVESHFGKARAEGMAAGAIVGAALRHCAFLHRMSLAVEAGQSAQAVIDNTKPPIHFRRKPAIDAALRAWPASRLLDALSRLSEALLDTRRHNHLADAIAHRCLMTLALAARRKTPARD